MEQEKTDVPTLAMSYTSMFVTCTMVCHFVLGRVPEHRNAEIAIVEAGDEQDNQDK